MPQLPPLPVRAQRCCAPTSPLAPAIAPAAGPGAALLRPYIASRPRHCPRCRSGRSAVAPLHRLSPPPLPPLPVRAQRCCAPTSPLAPAIAPAAGPGAALLRPYIASRPRHCPRCRSGRSAAAPLHRLSPPPLPPLPVRAQRCCAPTSPLAPAIAPAAGPGAALLRPYSLSPRVSHLSRMNGGASLSSTSSNSRAAR
jgi:hypothetical protein